MMRTASARGPQTPTVFTWSFSSFLWIMVLVYLPPIDFKSPEMILLTVLSSFIFVLNGEDLLTFNPPQLEWKAFQECFLFGWWGGVFFFFPDLSLSNNKGALILYSLRLVCLCGLKKVSRVRTNGQIKIVQSFTVLWNIRL